MRQQNLYFYCLYMPQLPQHKKAFIFDPNMKKITCTWWIESLCIETIVFDCKKKELLLPISFGGSTPVIFTIRQVDITSSLNLLSIQNNRGLLSLSF